MLSSICQNTQAAALYNFTYISNIDSIVYFSGGVITGLGPPNTTDIVTGSFYGTANGDIITGITPVGMTINGVSFTPNLTMSVTSDKPGNWWTTGGTPQVSFSGLNNNFQFRDTATNNYLYSIYDPTHVYQDYGRGFEGIVNGIEFSTNAPITSVYWNVTTAALYNFTYISNIDSIVYSSGGVITGLGPPNTTDTVTGSFYGTANGDIITGITPVSMTINGISFTPNLTTSVTSDKPDNWWTTGGTPQVSFSGLNNNFQFRDTATNNYLYSIYDPTHVYQDYGRGFEGIVNGIEFSTNAPITSVYWNVTTATMANQTITFGSAPTVSVGGTGTVSATGGASNNPVTFSSTTTGVCSVSGSTVIGLAVGTCTIAANQGGDANYNSAPQATQSFSVSGFALTVSIANSIGGTVASNVGGFACGRKCSASFASGTLITLTAIPVSGFEFTCWGGACRGYGNSCTVTMNAAQTVTANFTVFTIHQPVWKRVIKSIIKGGG